jgi:hypothetical protein
MLSICRGRDSRRSYRGCDVATSLHASTMVRGALWCAVTDESYKPRRASDELRPRTQATWPICRSGVSRDREHTTTAQVSMLSICRGRDSRRSYRDCDVATSLRASTMVRGALWSAVTNVSYKLRRAGNEPWPQVRATWPTCRSGASRDRENTTTAQASMLLICRGRDSRRSYRSCDAATSLRAATTVRTADLDRRPVDLKPRSPDR